MLDKFLPSCRRFEKESGVKRERGGAEQLITVYLEKLEDSLSISGKFFVSLELFTAVTNNMMTFFFSHLSFLFYFSYRIFVFNVIRQRDGGLGLFEFQFHTLVGQAELIKIRA